MRFCKECGHGVEGEGAFCRNCGAAVGGASGGSEQGTVDDVSSETAELDLSGLEGARSDAEAGDSGVDAASSGLRQQGLSSGGQGSGGKGTRSGKPRRPMSKRAKVFISAAAGLLVLLAVGYFVGNSMYSKESAAERLTDAINDEDTGALGKLLYSDDSSLEMDAAALDSFLTFLDKYPSYRDEVIQSALKQADMDEEAEAFGEDVGGDAPLTLKDRGSKWLVFNDYQFAIESIYLTVTTDIEGTELYINDDKVATADEGGYTKEIGPFMTGIYSARAELENDFGELKNEQDLELESGQPQQDMTPIQLDADYITIDVDDGINGKWIVDGNETDMDVADTSRMGPLSLDDDFSLSIKHEFPWGEDTSEDITIEEDGYVYVDSYPVSEDVTDALMEAGNQYYTSRAVAYSSVDKDKLSSVTDDFESVLASDIDGLKEWDDVETIHLDEIIYDVDSFYIFHQNSAYYAGGYTEIISREDMHDKDDEPDLSDRDYYENVTLMYDEVAEEWLVSETYSGYEALSGETETFEVDDDSVEASSGSGDGEDPDGSEGDADGDVSDVSDVDDDAIAELMDSYEKGIIKAINQNDFEIVEAYLFENSELHEAQITLVDRLNDIGTSEELIDYDIVDSTCEGDACKIDVDETVAITDDDGDTEENDYTWTYTAKLDDEGELKLSNIEER